MNEMSLMTMDNVDKEEIYKIYLNLNMFLKKEEKKEKKPTKYIIVLQLMTSELIIKLSGAYKKINLFRHTNNSC